MSWDYKDVLIYCEDEDYAKAHDELALYSTSFSANAYCARTLSHLIRQETDYARINVKGDNYDCRTFHSYKVLEEITETCDIDRVAFVLAHTILMREYDNRISDANKKWAKTVFFADTTTDVLWMMDGSCFFEWAMNCHSVLIDTFTTYFIEVYQRISNENM